MIPKMKVLETKSPEDLTDAINAHLGEGWKIAGNSYQAMSPSPGKTLYSILLMLMPVVDEED